MTRPTIRIADAYVAALAEHEPTAAQALGVPAGDRLPDFSAAWATERRDLDARTRAELAAVEPAPQDAGLHAALRERMDSDVALFDTGFSARLLAPLATPVHQIREAFDDVEVADDTSGDVVIERLAAVPHAITQLQERLRWARSAGERGEFSGTGVAAARQVREVADQVAGWIDPDGVDYFRSLRRAALSPARRSALDRAAQAATASMAEFERMLREELLPVAPQQDAVGEIVYRATAQSFLGTALDLDEVYDYGWSELDRLWRAARAVAGEIVGVSGQADVAEAARVLAADADSRVDADDVVGWLRDRLDWTLERVDGTAFRLAADIREVDIVVPRAAKGVVYYTPGAPDGSVRSKSVWTLPAGASSVPTWQELTSLHHEGVPGHHLEHAVNRANTSLHPWQRYLCEIHGYAEGWAHYSEALSDELGLLRTPAERLGMLLGQLWRTVRIVADIGLHTGRPVRRNEVTDRTEWTPEIARDFLVHYGLVDPATARFEVDRYLGWPGQALAFKVGAKLWDEARTASGASALDFHTRALALGPMGLAPLRDSLLHDSMKEDA
ncbi:DUF885 domain-containing protein [Microbacterium sp. NPDC028030]|uniref:DUF885 domain-containing protein n=1 Tax=Microbacterium sp. NPDC028030 TaxID=3155124 RepID=UPI0033F1AF8B